MGLLLAETPPFKFFQGAQGWNSLDSAEIRGIKNVGLFLEACCTGTDFVTGHRFMITLGHKKLTVEAFALSTPAEINLHVTRGCFVGKVVNVVFANRALSPLIGSQRWRWYEARGSASHLTTLQTIIVDFKAGITLKEPSKFSALWKAELRVLYHTAFQAGAPQCAYSWCSQAHQSD